MNDVEIYKIVFDIKRTLAQSYIPMEIINDINVVVVEKLKGLGNQTVLFPKGEDL